MSNFKKMATLTDDYNWPGAPEPGARPVIAETANGNPRHVGWLMPQRDDIHPKQKAIESYRRQLHG